VIWEVDGNQDVMVIGKAEYQSKGGVTIPLGRTACSVEVRTMIQSQGRSFPSPAAVLVIDTVSDVQIGYSISSAPSIGKFGGRNKKVTFVSTDGCHDVRVQVIASPGPVLPGSPEQGYPLLNVLLELAPGVPVTHPMTVPRNVSRPYWVRGFVLGGRGRPVHSVSGASTRPGWHTSARTAGSRNARCPSTRSARSSPGASRPRSRPFQPRPGEA
jgi:hypothetical protein